MLFNPLLVLEKRGGLGFHKAAGDIGDIGDPGRQHSDADLGGGGGGREVRRQHNGCYSGSRLL